MTVRKPLVVVSGELSELPTGDTIEGVSGDPPLIFTGFDGGSATTTVFDLTLDLGAA